ncbi:hypothetical protein HHI36_005488 [Cryptolaemus montrouzieri]|uniref:Uncharacterized protein n=1 Tax=Cryptolaemus montrouzieri TaxID=559131 RepID=A0ABD2NUK3_9CUCU
MQTSRVILNERGKKKPSSYHKICTYDHPIPYFGSETIHGYEYTHIKTPVQQLVFHKEEVRPTPISLPTPPASPEFYGTSLQKWYQKKPLLTLTAKGQVKRLEKYLQIQRTLEICKREHEFQVHTQDMKKAYIDFEFREHQPLLYEDKEVCCVCPCNSSKNYDIDFIPADYRTCSSPRPKFCMCQDDKDVEVPDQRFKSVRSVRLNRITPYYNGKVVVPDISNHTQSEPETSDTQPSNQTPTYTSDKVIDEEKIIPTKVVKEGEKDMDDHGIFKVVVKNKKKRRRSDDSKYVIKLYDNKNYEAGESTYFITEQPNPLLQLPNCSEVNSNDLILSKITLDHIATLPFDTVDGSFVPTSRSNCFSGKSVESRSMQRGKSSAAGIRYLIRPQISSYKEKFDENKNEIC